jgi:hypothetical protein
MSEGTTIGNAMGATDTESSQEKHKASVEAMKGQQEEVEPVGEVPDTSDAT